MKNKFIELLVSIILIGAVVTVGGNVNHYDDLIKTPPPKHL
jgi:hypothetical protein